MALDDQVNGVASLTGTFLFLATATLVLRFIARYRQKAAVSTTDYLAVASWVGFVGLAAVSFYGITHRFLGYTKPKSTAVVNAQHPMIEQTFITIDVLTAWTLGTAKLSALFFYRRIFCHGNPRDVFNYVTMVLVAICFAWTVTFFFLPLHVCGTHSLSWGLIPGHSAKCKANFPYFEATTISDFILDIFVVLTPLPKIWSLHMTVQRKFAVSGVFMLALAAVGASCARMVIFVDVVKPGRAYDDAHEDGYQLNTRMGYYAFLETGISAVCINLPSLWYFAAGVTVEGALASVRSVISLRSLRSNLDSTAPRETAMQTARHSATGLDMQKAGSHTNLNKNSTESSTTADFEPLALPAKPDMSVNNTFHHTENMA